MDDVQMVTKAYEMRQIIEKETVAVSEGDIKIVIGGDLKIREMSYNTSTPDQVKNAVNSAIRKAQEMQVLKMKELMV